MYNRVPKTGSTTVMDVIYRLCRRNKFSAIHMNVTRNQHTLHLPDQVSLISNISNWVQRKPAVYHGHLAFIDFTKFGHVNPIYIQVIREPLDRFVTYYYFLRCGDDHRPHLTRSRAGDNRTFDECVAAKGRDCDANKMWLQIPFFCGHQAQCWEPGNRWALEQAKLNVANHYALVGITTRLPEFIRVLEAMFPRLFDGAEKTLKKGDGHMRRTVCKKAPLEETVTALKETTVYQMELHFYEFVKTQFDFIVNRLAANQPVEGEWEARGTEMRYEKIKPKLDDLN